MVLSLCRLLITVHVEPLCWYLPGCAPVALWRVYEIYHSKYVLYSTVPLVEEPAKKSAGLCRRSTATTKQHSSLLDCNLLVMCRWLRLIWSIKTAKSTHTAVNCTLLQSSINDTMFCMYLNSSRYFPDTLCPLLKLKKSSNKPSAYSSPRVTGG